MYDSMAQVQGEHCVFKPRLPTSRAQIWTPHAGIQQWGVQIGNFESRASKRGFWDMPSRLQVQGKTLVLQPWLQVATLSNSVSCCNNSAFQH